MTNWKDEARLSIEGVMSDPDYRPRYRIPARRWGQLWKPKWEWVEGFSYNEALIYLTKQGAPRYGN